MRYRQINSTVHWNIISSDKKDRFINETFVKKKVVKATFL